MRAAARWGVPWSVLAGRRAPGEMWTPEDAALAMALVTFEDGLCSGCGQHLSQTTGRTAEWEWEAPAPLRCHACDLVAVKVEQHREHPRPQALRFHARRKPQGGGDG